MRINRHLLRLAGRELAVLALGWATISAGAADAASSAPKLLLKSASALDPAAHSVVLPLHRGTAQGRTVWYVLTDVSDASKAKADGLEFAPQFAAISTSASVTAHGGVWAFPSAPDFSKSRVFEPGPTGFPPAKAAPGAAASSDYLPFVRVDGSGPVYNAPIVATGDGPFDVRTHRNTADRVLAIDTAKKTVTLLLADGFAEGKRVLYISTEASDPGAATIERATYAPALGETPAAARLKIFVIVNGKGQGLADAALHGKLAEAATTADSAELGTSRNVLETLPQVTNGGGLYDPLWDVYVGAWSAAAVSRGRNGVLTSTKAVEAAAHAGQLTAPGGKPFGPAGFAVNCPVIALYP